jgi:hypothetical protein
MKKFTVHLAREYVVEIEAENEDAAREYTELYVSGGIDDSSQSFRIEKQFQIQNIKPVLNEATCI